MIGSDLRYAWRSLSHQKLGTGLVVGMLALGIGATVAVFSLINGLFLRPFPFPEPERLVYINETAPKWNLEQTGVSFADFTHVASRSAGVRGDRALRRNRVQRRDRRGRRSHEWRRA